MYVLQITLCLTDEIGACLTEEIGVCLTNEIGVCLTDEIGVCLADEIGGCLTNPLAVSSLAGLQQGAGGDLPHPERLRHPRPRASPAADPREQGLPGAPLPDVLQQVQRPQLHQEPLQIRQVRCGCCGKDARQFL